jgi:hypothetical protein
MKSGRNISIQMGEMPHFIPKGGGISGVNNSPLPDLWRRVNTYLKAVNINTSLFSFNISIFLLPTEREGRMNAS